VSARQFAALLERAKCLARPLRLHERGDFGNGKPHSVDGRYVRALETALDKVKGAVVWTYTHIYHKRLAALSARGVSMYASVHNASDIEQAQRAGFKLFALVLPYRPKRCKPQVRALPVYDGPRFIEQDGRRYLVCPAQHNPNGKKITCSQCRHCIEGRGNVAFLTH